MKTTNTAQTNSSNSSNSPTVQSIVPPPPPLPGKKQAPTSITQNPTFSEIINTKSRLKTGPAKSSTEKQLKDQSERERFLEEIRAKGSKFLAKSEEAVSVSDTSRDAENMNLVQRVNEEVDAACKILNQFIANSKSYTLSEFDKKLDELRDKIPQQIAKLHMIKSKAHESDKKIIAGSITKLQMKWKEAQAQQNLFIAPGKNAVLEGVKKYGRDKGLTEDQQAQESNPVPAKNKDWELAGESLKARKAALAKKVELAQEKPASLKVDGLGASELKARAQEVTAVIGGETKINVAHPNEQQQAANDEIKQALNDAAKKVTDATAKLVAAAQSLPSVSIPAPIATMTKVELPRPQQTQVTEPVKPQQAVRSSVQQGNMTRTMLGAFYTERARHIQVVQQSVLSTLMHAAKLFFTMKKNIFSVTGFIFNQKQHPTAVVKAIEGTDSNPTFATVHDEKKNNYEAGLAEVFNAANALRKQGKSKIKRDISAIQDQDALDETRKQFERYAEYLNKFISMAKNGGSINLYRTDSVGKFWQSTDNRYAVIGKLLGHNEQDTRLIQYELPRVIANIKAYEKTLKEVGEIIKHIESKNHNKQRSVRLRI